MKLLRNKTIINFGLLVLGVAAVALSAIPFGSLVQKLAEAVGTGLIATAFINFLEIYLNGHPSVRHPVILDLNRSKIGSLVHNKKYQAEEVDLVAMALKDCLEEIAQNQHFIDRLLFHSTQVRIVIVDPRAAALKQRLIDDHSDTMEQILDRQYQSVENCVRFYQRLKKGYDKAINEKKDLKPFGSLVIRLIDANPYITMARYDKEIYWGLYTADRSGMNSPLFLTTDPDRSQEETGDKESRVDLFHRLQTHFDALMNNNYPALPPTIDQGRVVTYGVQGPLLNEPLVKAVLPVERYQRLFKNK